ncbi:MAG: DNA polymerase III subunit delta [Gemmatimonadetes bacterium]|nr:DNA polymerase III subunit delta [Gemmatimonadota bacterium]
MGALSFDALFRRLKKGNSVYYLYGDEDVLKDEAVRALVDRTLEPSTRDFNLDLRDAAVLDAATFHALVNTPPMLAEQRVVVLRGVEQLRKKSPARDELLRYLGSPNPTTVLVLVQGAAEKPDADLAHRSTAVALDRLPPEGVVRWIARKAGELPLALEPDAVDLLIEAVGNDLGAIRQELEKLALIAPGRAATADDVASVVGVRHGETVHDLVEAALERRPVRAAQLVEPVLEQAGMNGVRVVTTLGTALVGTALARAELDCGTPPARLEDAMFRHLVAARPFGLRNWKEEAARWARWATLWSPAELRRVLRLALEADRALKGTTVTDDRGIVLQLVLAMAVAMREAA